MPEVVVIGGGAGGMLAALAAAEGGASVTLLERMEKLGRKVYITGKGRCNVTNDCTLDEFMKEVPHNPRFLYSALTAFTPQDMMSLLEDSGCPVVVQRGRRVFPSTEKASDVTRALERRLVHAGVRILYHMRVAKLCTEDGRISGCETDTGRFFPADAVILATGGLSAPLTGSSGDGYRLAEALGHTIQPTKPSLSALVTSDGWEEQLQGLALKNVTITLKSGKKTCYEALGEMLFTHFGISGPIVLEMSCHLPDKLQDAQVYLNCKPGLNPDQLDARLQREFEAQPKKMLSNVLCALLPSRMAELFPAICGIDGSRPCGQLTREERQNIVRLLQQLPITLKSMRPIDEAIITRGGITVKEISPATMESKLVPGLFFAGEVIDVDAHTGGYNLQIAFSTGTVAGRSAADICPSRS